MMDIDLDLGKKVKDAYGICHHNDISHPERFYRDGEPVHNSRGEFYVAPFDVYRRDYERLSEFGIEIVDPDEIGYEPGRKGMCRRLVLTMLGRTGEIDIVGDIQQIMNEEPIEEPEENCVVVYNARGYATPEIFVPTHWGIIREGRVLSKWNFGPIFSHDLSAMPYVGFQDEGILHRHWIEFRPGNPKEN